MAHQGGVIEVLLTDAEEWPGHFAGGVSASTMGGRVDSWDKWRGRPIRILAIPLDPLNYRECDTDYIWQVMPQSVEHMTGVPPEKQTVPFYVCRHQIQIGD